VRHHGRAIVWAAFGWGAAIAMFGAVDHLGLALGFLALAGACDMVSGLFRSQMWNQSIPDALRGRMAGIELLSYSIGPTLGQVRVSVAASRYGLRPSLVSGGLLCMAGVALLTFCLPSLWRYDATTDANTLEQKRIRALRDSNSQAAE
jgi:hypothetical protein